MIGSAAPLAAAACVLIGLAVLGSSVLNSRSALLVRSAQSGRAQHGARIQPDLLQAVRAAATPQRNVFVSVGSRKTVLYQLPLLLSSMRLVQRADLSQHLVVICSTPAALSACRRLHKSCLIDDWGTARSILRTKGDGLYLHSSPNFFKVRHIHA